VGKDLEKEQCDVIRHSRFTCNTAPSIQYVPIIRAFVAASLAPGAVVKGDRPTGEDLSRPDLSIYRWRREIGVANGFAQVLIAPVGDGAGCPTTPAIEIEFAGKARVRIPASIPTGLAAAVVKALSGL
jgi:hypothetical protein